MLSPEWFVESDGRCRMEDDVNVLLQNGSVVFADANVILHDVASDQVNLLQEVGLSYPQLVVQLHIIKHINYYA